MEDINAKKKALATQLLSEATRRTKTWRWKDHLKTIGGGRVYPREWAIRCDANADWWEEVSNIATEEWIHMNEGNDVTEFQRQAETEMLEYFKTYLRKSLDQKRYYLLRGPKDARKEGEEFTRYDPEFSKDRIVMDLAARFCLLDPEGFVPLRNRVLELCHLHRQQLVAESVNKKVSSKMTFESVVRNAISAASCEPWFTYTQPPQTFDWKNRYPNDTSAAQRHVICLLDYTVVREAHQRASNWKGTAEDPQCFRSRGQALYPAWQGFLDRTSHPEVFMAFVWKIFKPEDTGRQLLWCWGEGSAGVSVVWTTIAKFLPDVHVETSFSRVNQFTAGTVVGKRLVTTSDGGVSDILEHSLVKNITGKDIVSAEEKQKAPTSVQVYARVVVYSNLYPVFDPTQASMRTRALVTKTDEYEGPAGRFEEDLRAQFWDFLAACEDVEKLLCPPENGGMSTPIPVPLSMEEDIILAHCMEPRRLAIRQFVKHHVIYDGGSALEIPEIVSAGMEYLKRYFGKGYTEKDILRAILSVGAREKVPLKSTLETLLSRIRTGSGEKVRPTVTDGIPLWPVRIIPRPEDAEETEAFL